MKTNKDFWKFAEDDLMKGLYWEELYNKGRRVTEFRWVVTISQTKRSILGSDSMMTRLLTD